MSPAIAAQSSSSVATKGENANSLKVIEELLSKLSVSKTPEEVNSTATNIATFINGDIEENDAPTK